MTAMAVFSRKTKTVENLPDGAHCCSLSLRKRAGVRGS